MKILLDHNLDWRLARSLPSHEVKSATQMNWGGLQNGKLLAEAEKEGFAVMLTADKSIKNQQRMQGRFLALIVLRAPNSKLKTHQQMIPEVEQALLSIQSGEIFHSDLTA